MSRRVAPTGLPRAGTEIPSPKFSDIRPNLKLASVSGRPFEDGNPSQGAVTHFINTINGFPRLIFEARKRYYSLSLKLGTTYPSMAFASFDKEQAMHFLSEGVNFAELLEGKGISKEAFLCFNVLCSLRGMLAESRENRNLVTPVLVSLELAMRENPLFSSISTGEHALRLITPLLDEIEKREWKWAVLAPSVFSDYFDYVKACEVYAPGIRRIEREYPEEKCIIARDGMAEVLTWALHASLPQVMPWAEYVECEPEETREGIKFIEDFLKRQDA